LKAMPFRYLLRNRHGDDAGMFVTAAPEWREGDVYMLKPGDRILEMIKPADDDTHGVWVIEAVDADAA